MKIEDINKTGRRVFYNPTTKLEYEFLAQKSLGPNTFRGFHKIDKIKPGSSHVFKSVLIENSQSIIKQLNNLKTEKELNDFSNELCKELLKGLKKNINNKQLASYNKIRKPVDIVIEHLVSMGEDFNQARERITKHLFLPLDSQMFQSEFVFSNSEIRKLNLSRRFTFKDIYEIEHYFTIQEYLKNKASKIGLEERIYFDLIWNNRYNSKGGNLFETN